MNWLIRFLGGVSRADISQIENTARDEGYKRAALLFRPSHEDIKRIADKMSPRQKPDNKTEDQFRRMLAKKYVAPFIQKPRRKRKKKCNES
jgi:hypothetical protein